PASLPSCYLPFDPLKYEGIDAKPPFGTGTIWKAITLKCPHCSTILSAAIDPIAIKNDIVNAIKNS
ncbi:hypothetical protein ACC712_37725, partial [Rhizobium ruizarguesonis]